MKSLLFVLLISFLVACNSENLFVHHPNDTVRTVGLFIDPSTGAVRGDILYKVTADTSRLDTLSDGTFKKISKRDSVYFYPAIIKATDSTGKILKDSIGNPINKVAFAPIDKGLVLEDYNRKF